MRKLDDDDNLGIICDNLKKKWPALTSEDLKYVQGQEKEFVARIQSRTNESQENVEKAIREAMITGDMC